MRRLTTAPTLSHLLFDHAAPDANFIFSPLKEWRDPTSPGPFSLAATLPCSPLFLRRPTPDASVQFSSQGTQAVGGVGEAGGDSVSCRSVGWKRGVGSFGSSPQSRGRFQVPGVVQTLPFRLKET